MRRLESLGGRKFTFRLWRILVLQLSECHSPAGLLVEGTEWAINREVNSYSSLGGLHSELERHGGLRGGGQTSLPGEALAGTSCRGTAGWNQK